MDNGLKKLGSFIHEIDVRNKELKVTNLIGVSITKEFMPSVANVVGTDLSNYKVIQKNQFACSLMQVSRDGGVAIALYSDRNPSIMSPAYYIFEINSDELLPEYLELIVKSSIFDREAVFNAIGGVRGTLTWDEFCDLQIKVPDLAEQTKIVNQLKAISKRIFLLENINEKLTNNANLQINKLLFKKGEIADLDKINEITLPENWKVYKLSDLAECQSGYAFYKDGYDEEGLRIVDLGNITIRAEFLKLKEDKKILAQRVTADKFKKFKLKKNDLIMVMTDRKSTMELLGKTAIIDDDSEEMLLNQRVYRVRFKNNPEFFFVYLNSSIVHYYHMAHSSGTAQKYVNNGDIDNIPIIIPDDATFKLVNSICTPLVNLLTQNKKEIEALYKLLSVYKNSF